MSPDAGFRVWDLHVHLSGVAGRTAHERMARLIEHADRLGIERLCVYMGLKWSEDPSPDNIRRQNDDVLEGLSHWHDRVFGFAYVSPKHFEASLKEIDRCIRNGPMVGIKLWMADRCRNEEIDPIIGRAAELGAVIFQHTWKKTGGNRPGESTPEDLVALALRHPQVPFICGHTGGNWEWGVRAVRRCANVSVDLAGSDPTSGIVEMAVRELSADRVIYGSDAGGRSFASQLAKVYSAKIPDEAKQKIFSGNLRRMMAPILAAKGAHVR